MTERKLFQKQDLILIIILLALALVLITVYTFLNHSIGKAQCQILYDGKLVKTIDLSEDSIFALEQNPNVRFEVRNIAIAFIESDCPDKVCVHSGFLNQPGQMAACLPNRVSIRIIDAEGQNDVDMIAN